MDIRRLEQVMALEARQLALAKRAKQNLLQEGAFFVLLYFLQLRKTKPSWILGPLHPPMTNHMETIRPAAIWYLWAIYTL